VNEDVGLDVRFTSTLLTHAIDDVSSSSSEMGVKSSTMTLMGSIRRVVSVLKDVIKGRTSGRRQGTECFLKPSSASASSLCAQDFSFLQGGCSFMSGSTMTGVAVLSICCIIALVVFIVIDLR
jgi:hypothetical protein